jgi:hypothetical protein
VSSSETYAALYFTENIRHAPIHKITVILDFRTATYFALNEPASAFWNLISTCDGQIDRICGELTSRSSLSDPSIECSSFYAFVDDCVSRGFLTYVRPVDQRDSIQLPTSFGIERSMPDPLGALFSLYRTRHMLGRHGFSATYECYAKYLPKPSQPGSEERLKQALSTFLKAENLALASGAPDDCLPRSLSLFRFLRNRGIPSSLNIGCRDRPPLLMHAWVEVNGKDPLEDAMASDLIRIASIE